MRWLTSDEFLMDAATGFAIPVLGDMPLICHRNTLTNEIRTFYQAAGIHLGGEYLTYASIEEAIHLAKECHARGLRLAYYYPPPDQIAGNEYLVVPQTLYNWLNDKTNIDQLCEARHLPRHRFFSLQELGSIADYLPQQAIYVKLCHPGVSGAGYDVRFCPDPTSRQMALEWMATRPPGWPAIRVEEAVDIRESWCLNLGIGSAGVRYLGAATQLFSSPATQSGSRIDPQDQPSGATITLAMEIARRSYEHGFLGVAGFDIGETNDGKPYVFDLNFRAAVSTPQVMLHQTATQRIGGNLSQSWKTSLPGPLAPALQHLEKFALSGRFIPLRLYESSQQAGDSSRINAMLVARNQAEMDKLTAEVGDALNGLVPNP